MAEIARYSAAALLLLVSVAHADWTAHKNGALQADDDNFTAGQCLCADDTSSATFRAVDATNVTAPGSTGAMHYTTSGGVFGAMDYVWDTGDSRIESDAGIAWQLDADSDGLLDSFIVYDGGGNRVIQCYEVGSCAIESQIGGVGFVFDMPNLADVGYFTANTTDTSDNQCMALLSAGTSLADTRGAGVMACGNEVSTANLYGDLILSAGDGNSGSDGGDIDIQTGSTSRITITDDGQIDVSKGSAGGTTLDVDTATFAYPTNGWNGLTLAPTITGVTASAPNFDGILVTPAATYTSAINMGFGSNIGVGVAHTLTSGGALGSGSDNVNMFSFYSQPNFNGAVGPRTANQLISYYAQPKVSGGVATSVFSFHAQPASGSGTATAGYGFRCSDIIGTTDWCLYSSSSGDDNYLAGWLGIGDASPASGNLLETGTGGFVQHNKVTTGASSPTSTDCDASAEANRQTTVENNGSGVWKACWCLATGGGSYAWKCATLS